MTTDLEHIGISIPVHAAAFPIEEYDARLRAVRAAMDEQGVGTLLVASPENVCYLIGLDHLGYFAFTLLILPLEGRPMLVIRAMERPTVELQTPQSVFVPYGDQEDPAATVIGALRALGSTAGRIGVERSTMYLPIDVWERIGKGLPGARWADASQLVSRVRSVKSPREIATVRRAAAISDRALQAGIGTAGEGVTEREVAAAIYAELISAGSQTPGFPPLVRSTPSLALEHVTWSDRRLTHGDTLFLELSASVARYHAPVSRMAYVGATPDGAHEAAKIVAAGMEAISASLRPDARGADVYASWQAAMDAGLGCPARPRHHCGYMVGIGFPPSWSSGGVPVGLAPGGDLVIEAGMTFHAMSWLLGQGPVNYGVSDAALVTEDGCELLTRTARDPIVV